MKSLKCKLCNRVCKNTLSLGIHISKTHKILPEKYYLKYINVRPKKFCVICSEPTKFLTIGQGYRKYCSQKCVKEYLKSDEVALKKKTTCLKKYGVEYPNQNELVKEKNSRTHKIMMSNPKEREKISVATKLAMQRDDVKQKFLKAVRKPKSKITLHRMSISSKQKFINDPTLKDRIYTKERNNKISKSKKIYWNTHPEERKRIMDIWKKRSETSLEIRMYKFLTDSKIEFKKRHEIEQKQYDAYLPKYNVLLEFDGDFWHKQSLDECKYSFQTFNFYNDRRKDEIAKSHNIPLFRIKENDSPEKIIEYIKSIK